MQLCEVNNFGVFFFNDQSENVTDMTSTEPAQVVKKGNECTKKSPLKVVSPILKKYSGHRQGKIKKKLKFPKILNGSRAKQKKQLKPQLKTILPKTNAGDLIILEPELLPCALNPQKRKKVDEVESGNEAGLGPDAKEGESPQTKDASNKLNKSKLLPSNKKKVKCLRNIEASLELLESKSVEATEKREQVFVQNYLLKVYQRLKGKDESLYDQFLGLISNFQANGLTVCDLYKKVKSLFHMHLDLSEEFICFLTPEQAVECGVLMEHLLLTTMCDFLSMIDVYFSKSPQQIRKIHSVLESLAAKSNLTTEYVTSAVLPLLKGNPVLRDYFLQLLPNSRPPETLLTDFEEIEYPELNSDLSDDEEINETVHLPEIEDPYGGDTCPCKCHDVEDDKFKHRGDHCLSCSLKFINGKIFIQQGKLLKPARVVFADHDISYHRDRLAPKLHPKRGKKRHRHVLLKDSLSPTKSSYLSSDEFKSDIEDEERGRFKLAQSKSPRTNRKKSISPKHCDKIPKTGLGDSKPESCEMEEKPVFSKCLNFSFKEEEGDGTKTGAGGVGVVSEEEPPRKLLDLPEIGLEDKPTEPLSMVSLNDSGKSESENGDGVSVYVNEGGSNSPPVISIPDDSETSLFPDAKPIISMLENLDGGKESQGVLENLDERMDFPGKKEEKDDNPWKIEEDRVILQTLQVEENCEETFVKIGKNIPARSVEDIKKRFAELMVMLYEMKAKTNMA